MGDVVPENSADRSILVVEDDDVLARLYRRVLVQRGWTVAVASTEPDGIAAFEESRPRVVLTDYRLPKGDGISLVEKIKRIEPRAEAVLISGYLTPELVNRATSIGMFECLRKPVELARILQTVESAFARAVEDIVNSEPQRGDDLLRHLQSRVDSTAQYAVAIDTDYKIVAGNAPFFERFGKQTCGMRCYEIFSALKRVCAGCRAVAAVESGKKCRLAHAPRLIDGAPVEFEEHIEPYQSAGERRHLILTVSEVEHVKPRAVVQQGAAERTDHDEGHESYVIVTGLDGKILFANDLFQREFLGDIDAKSKTFFDFCDSYFLGTLEKQACSFQQWIEQNRSLRSWTESRLGKRALIHWDFNVLDLPGHDTPVVVCVGCDRERLHAVQRWAQFYDTCYREIFRYQFGMVLVCNSDREIIAANERLLRVLDARPRDIIGRPLTDFLAFEEDTHQLEAHSRELRLREATDNFRIRMRAPNGTVFSALASLVSITNAYNVTEGYALVLQDVEEQEKFEQMLTHIEEMYNLGGLSAGIAHQMNNCLHTIINWAELMKLEPESAPSPDLIIETATRMQQLSAEILQLARKSQSAAGEPFSINHTIETLTLLTSRRMKQDSIAFETRLAEDVPALRVSEAKLEHVILNLVTNAVEALRETAPDAGTRTITVTTSCDADAVYVNVADTGPGILESIRDKVFNRFFTTKRSGTGLGLSLSLGIMDSIGGRIELVRTGRDGTEFRLTIPTSLPDGTE